MDPIGHKEWERGKSWEWLPSFGLTETMTNRIHWHHHFPLQTDFGPELKNHHKDTSLRSSEVGALDHIVVLFLIFSGTSKLFSTAAASLCIPINSAKRFQFLHNLANIYYIFKKIIATLARVSWSLLLVFIYISLMINDVQQSICLLCISISLQHYTQYPWCGNIPNTQQ